MTKILYSLVVLAIVAIALLVGSATAAESSVTSGGNVAPCTLSLAVTQGCANLNLVRGTTVDCSDTVCVTANQDWKLEVKDPRPDLGMDPSYRGYMTRASGIGAPLTRITYPFILKAGSAVNNDLRSGTCLVKGDGNAPANPTCVNVPYSQQVSGSEVAGDYSIQLTYILSARA